MGLMITNFRKSAAYRAGYNAGMLGAAAFEGTTPNDVVRMSSFCDASMAHLPMQKAICKSARIILHLAGREGSPEYQLYSILEKKSSALHPYLVERFIIPAVEAIAAGNKVVVEEERMAKNAGMIPLLVMLGRSLGRTAGSLPSAASSLAALSAAGGGGIGALAWALNRDATQSEASTEALSRQAQHYRRIADDMKKRLNLEQELKGGKPLSKRDATNAMEEAGEGGYVL